MRLKQINPAAENEKYFLFILAGIVFIALLFRNCGLNLVVSDEYIYSKASRLLPFSYSDFPNYLYFLIYRTTNFCGAGFLDCVRVLNSLFFVAAAPFIYMTARRVCTRNIALSVALLALLGPINSYTAYFMPESLYFLSFWLLTWFILRIEDSSGVKAWCFAGVLLGLVALVKPHALFLFLAIAAYIFYVVKNPHAGWVALALRNTGVLLALTLLVKFSIGYLLAGSQGVTLFGTSYTSVVTSTASNIRHYLDLLALSATTLQGHVLALCLMFGLPIAIAVNTSFKSAFSRGKVKPEQKIYFYTLSILVSLVFVVSFFTASVVGYSKGDTITRLHMRYYDFVLPLLFIVVASQLSVEATISSLKSRAIIALPIGSAILYAIYTNMAPYIFWFVDSPELSGFILRPKAFYILGGVSFFALASWVYKTKVGVRIFCYLFLPLAVVYSSINVNQELRQHLVPDVFDRAGIFTKQYLSNDELPKLLVVGSELGGLSKSLFYIDHPESSLEVIAKGARYDLSKRPVGKEWILLIDGRKSPSDRLPEDTIFQLPMNGFTLVRTTSLP